MTLIDNLDSIQDMLTRYVLTIGYILGFIGCICNLMVFYQRKLRKSTCSIYFIATSIFNLLVIVFGMTPVLVASYLAQDPSKYSVIYCKARSYTTHVFLMLSRSSVALTCIDRFALCSRNVFIRSLCQRRIALILIIIVSILWIVIPTHIIIYIDIYPPGRCSASGIYQIVYTIYAAIVTSIPLIIMIVFSIWAIQSLQQTQARIRPIINLTNENLNTNINIRRRDIQLIAILISEVVVYVFSTTWFPVNTIYTVITANIFKTTDRLAIEGFIRYLAVSFLIFLNPCSLFYAHLFASKTFRQECQQLFFRVCKRSPNSNDRGFQATTEVFHNQKQINRLYVRQQIDHN
ncbi:hypothetical protein I4U23_007857 [Adineta vaga]|nr:hypothetical protein I4U23_007857 [Adineta vaga]